MNDTKYTSKCIECGKEYQNMHNVPFGMCPDCLENHMEYCDRCCQEITYYEYMENCGLCDECAEEIEFEDDM